MYVYTILWYSGPPRQTLLRRETGVEEGGGSNYRCRVCSAFLRTRGTRVRWNTSRVRRPARPFSPFSIRSVNCSRGERGSRRCYIVGMSERWARRGVIMARIIAKLKKINADTECTFRSVEDRDLICLTLYVCSWVIEQVKWTWW